MTRIPRVTFFKEQFLCVVVALSLVLVRVIGRVRRAVISVAVGIVRFFLTRSIFYVSFEAQACQQVQVGSQVPAPGVHRQGGQYGDLSCSRRMASLMPCYHPLSAFRCADGSVVFAERRGMDIIGPITLPCGQCVGCRLERSRQWAMRCVHEASLSKWNCFLTLTYDDHHLPDRGQLVYSDFQKFIKRFRKEINPDHYPDRRCTPWHGPRRPLINVRYYMCGEYGEKDQRPHFHACVFGVDFADKYRWKKTKSGHWLYRSPFLETLWTAGNSLIGEVNFLTAGYVARYCMKKVTGTRALSHYQRLDHETGELYSMEPEFTHMSLKPGIGTKWFEKFLLDVYPHDYVAVNGRPVKPPKFYDKKYQAIDPESFEAIQFERELDAALRKFDNTPERLAVKELVATAALARLSRDSL